MKNLIFALLVLTVLSCTTQRPVITDISKSKLVKLWESDSTLKVPESVLLDKQRNVLYVTNIEGTDPWGKDGKGSVARLSTDGKILDAEWISGLNAPKGMGMYKGKLYVADLTDLVIIDISKNAIESTVPVSAAQGLNDVSIGNDGAVYISDSKAKMVYRYKDGVTDVVLKDLKGPNGVLSHNGILYVLDSGGMYQMKSDNSLTLISDGMAGGTDGIENIDRDNFIVSAWGGTVWLVNTSGAKHVLLDTRDKKINSADIGIDHSTNIIYVPTFWKNSVVAYRLSN